MPRLTDAPADLRRFFAQQIQSASAQAPATRLETARSATAAAFEDAGSDLSTVATAYAEAADPVRLAEQEIAALAVELDTPVERLQPNLSSGLSQALAVATPLAEAPPPPPPSLTDVLAGALGAEDPHKLLSLSMLDVGTATLANPTVARRMVDNYADYTACHDIAAGLNRLLGRGPAKTAKGAAGVELAQAALASKDAVVHLQYKHPKGGGHSFTLVSTPKSVESIEGWAGADARYAFPLHECVFDRPRDDIPHRTASEAIGRMLDPRRSVRSKALDQVSRAGLPGFEAGYPASEMELTVTVRPLDTPGNVASALAERLRKAKDLVASTEALTNPDVSVTDLQEALGAVQEEHDDPTPGQVREVLARRGDLPGRIDAIVKGLQGLGLL